MEELRRFLGWLLPRHAALGGLTEIRILGRGTRSGVWAAMVGPKDLDDLVDALSPLGEQRERIPAGDHPRSGEADVYFSLQPVDPSRRPHTGARLERVRRTTRDADVRAYSLFVVDIDPERHPRDRSATEAEKDAGPWRPFKPWRGQAQLPREVPDAAPLRREEAGGKHG